MTIGERIVADLRRDVFAHLISLSPAFFDSARSGELVSRLTADTTQIKSAVGASVSIALRNLLLFIGATAMMVITSPKTVRLRAAGDPGDRDPAGGVRALGAAAVAQRPGYAGGRDAYASELLGAIRTVQAFTGEQVANARFGGEVEQAYEAARDSTRARAILTLIIIFIVFSSVVAILWVGSHDVLTGAITPGPAWPVRVVRSLRGQRARTAQRGLGGSFRRLRRRRAAVRDPAGQVADRGAAAPLALPVPARGDVGFDNVSFAYPTRPDAPAVDGVSLSVRAGEKVAIVGPSGAGKSTLFHLLLRFYDPAAGAISLDGVPIRVGRSARVALAHRAGAAGIGGVRRDRARKHPLRPARRQRCRGRARRRSGARQRIHPPPARRHSRRSSASAA